MNTPAGPVAPLPERALALTVGACSCLTKTPDIAYHDPNCLYRVLTECAIALSGQSNASLSPPERAASTPEGLVGPTKTYSQCERSEAQRLSAEEELFRHRLWSAALLIALAGCLALVFTRHMCGVELTQSIAIAAIVSVTWGREQISFKRYLHRRRGLSSLHGNAQL